MKSRIREYMVSELVMESLRIYRQHFWLLIGLCMPAAVLHEILAWPLRELLGSGKAFFWMDQMALFPVLGIFLWAPLTVAVSDSCLGHRPAFVRSFRRGFEVSFKLLTAYLICQVAAYAGALLLTVSFFIRLPAEAYRVAMYAGALLLIVLGWLALVYWTLFIPVVVIERRGPIDALRRSYGLVKGAFWKTIWLIAMVLFLFFAYAVLIAFLIPVIGTVLEFPAEDRLLYEPFYWLGIPCGLAPFVLYFYDRRVVTESFDAAALTQDLID